MPTRTKPLFESFTSEGKPRIVEENHYRGERNGKRGIQNVLRARKRVTKEPCNFVARDDPPSTDSQGQFDRGSVMSVEVQQHKCVSKISMRKRVF